MQNVLIVGYGELGSRLSKFLSSQYNLLALKKTPLENPSVNLISTDITDQAQVQKAKEENPIFFSSPDLLVYCVAPSTDHDLGPEERYENTYIKGLKNILNAIGNSQKCLLVSSTSVYGGNTEKVIDEKTAPTPDSFRGETMLEMEELLLNSSKVSTKIILRASGLYGKSPNLPGSRGPKNRIINRIQIDDCAKLGYYLINNSPKDSSEIYIGVDNQPASYNDLSAHLTSSINKEANYGKSYSNKKIKSLGFTFAYSSYKDFYKQV